MSPISDRPPVSLYLPRLDENPSAVCPLISGLWRVGRNFVILAQHTDEVTQLDQHVSDLQQALLPLITECKLTRNNTTSIYRYTIVLSYICALIRSCIRSHTVVMLSGARRPCVHLGCVTPAARCKFYLQLPLGSSILSYHCERLTRQFGIVTQITTGTFTNHYR